MYGKQARINSRNKGQRGEREVIKILQPIVTKVHDKLSRAVPELTRNLEQTRNGGYDIIGLPWASIEVKYCEKLNIDSWWQQTLRQTNNGQIPILVHRSNNKPWRARMKILINIGQQGVYSTVDIDLPTFLIIFELLLIKFIEARK
jgi:hypothetical protein